MAPFVLKFKGNKSFSPFSNLSDEEGLRRTWKVCTKVAAHLEQGQRLENLSWRLWHLHSTLVANGQLNSSKGKREFKKLSKSTGEKLDKDRNKPLDELEAPVLRRTPKVTTNIISKSSLPPKPPTFTNPSAYPYSFYNQPQYSTYYEPPQYTPASALLQQFEAADEAERAKLLERQRALEAVRAKDREREERRRIERLRMAALMEATQGSEWDSKNVQQPTAAKTNPASGIQEMLVASVMNQPSIQREKLLKTSSAIAGKYGEGIIAPTPAPINMTDVGTGTLSSSYGAYMPASGPYPELRTPSPSSISSHELSHHIQVENNLFDPPDLTEQDREFVQHSMFFSGFDSMFSDFHPSAILAPWDPFAFGSSRPVVELPLDGFLQDIEREAMNSTRLPAIVEIDGAETDSPPNQGEGEGQRNQGTQTVDATSHPTAPVHPWDPNFHPPLAFPLSNFDYSLGVTVTPDRFKQQHAELPPVDPVLPIEENRRSSSPESTGSSSPSSRHSTTSSTRLAVWHPPLLPPVFPEPIETTAATTMWGYNQPANQDHHGSAIQAFVSQKEDAPSTVEAIPAPQTEKRTQKKHKNPHATQAPMHVSASDSRPQCSNCGAYQTPLWRRGNNEELLCNACGLYLKLHKTHRPKSFGHKAPAAAPTAKHHHAPASSSTSTTTASAPPPRKMTAEGPVHCKNCKADQTPMWRKVDGQLLCNACALYAKMHKAPRPIGNNGRKRKASVSVASSEKVVPPTANRRHSESDVKGGPHIPGWKPPGRRPSMNSKETGKEAPQVQRTYASLPRSYSQDGTGNSSVAQPHGEASGYYNWNADGTMDDSRKAKKPRIDSFAPNNDSDMSHPVPPTTVAPQSYTYYQPTSSYPLPSSYPAANPTSAAFGNSVGPTNGYSYPYGTSSQHMTSEPA